MTILNSRTVNFFKALGQTALLFLLGNVLILMSYASVSLAGQWGGLAFGILVGTLPFISFYLAGFLLAPKRFYQAKIWKKHPSWLRWVVIIVCALSGYMSMGEVNIVMGISAPHQPMPVFDQLLIAFSAIILSCFILPFRVVLLFRCLGLAKTNAMEEVLEDHNSDMFAALILPPLLTCFMVFWLMSMVLVGLSASYGSEDFAVIAFLLLEIVVAFDIAYVCLNKTGEAASLFTQDSAAFSE